MENFVRELRLPQISIVLALSSTEDDARVAAHEMISDRMNLDYFEILHVKLMEEGSIRTSSGMKQGKRYTIVFRECHAEIVFVHPDYDKLMGHEN